MTGFVRSLRQTAPVLLSLFLLVTGGVLISYGQQDEKSALITYVEEQISSPSYQIRLNGLEGTLSSDVALESITIADANGIWLTIEEPRLIWTRTALLTGTLKVNSLTARRIVFERTPLPESDLPSPEATAFELPQLPVSVIMEQLDLPLVQLGEAIFKPQSDLSVAGKFVLEGGSLDTDLEINRLAKPNGPSGSVGQLKAFANYQADEQFLALDVALSEPQGGIAAAALGLEYQPGSNQTPAVALSIKGSAPLNDLRVIMAFDVAGRRILDGQVVFDDTREGLTARTDLSGPLGSILPEAHQALFGEESRLEAQMVFPKAGGFALRPSRLSSGSIDATASARTTADGFLSALNLDVSLVNSQASRMIIPGVLTGDDNLSLAGASLDLTYDAARAENWTGRLVVDELASGEMSAESMQINANGKVENFQTADRRFAEFVVNGRLSGINASDTAIAGALGRVIDLRSSGSWQAGEPLQLADLKVFGETFNLSARGALNGAMFEGRAEVQAENLAAFSALADRDLAGAADVQVVGKVDALSGGFDLDVEGVAQSLQMGFGNADRLLTGDTRLSGGAARNKEGLLFRNFQIDNRQVQASLNGRLASESAKLAVNALVRDLSVVDARSSGSVKFDMGIVGDARPFDLDAKLGFARGSLSGKAVENLELGFSGKLGNGVSGKLSSSGFMAGDAIELTGMLETTETGLTLENLEARIGGTRISGSLSRGNGGLMDSELIINSRDISAMAALALTEASGRVDGKLTLMPGPADTQSATIDLDVSNLAIADTLIGKASIKAGIADLLDTPRLGGTMIGQNVLVSGTRIGKIRAVAESENSLTRFRLNAELAQNNASIQASGQLEQMDRGSIVSLDQLGITSNLADIRLVSPTGITIVGDDLRVAETKLDVGGGRVTISGRAGNRLDLVAQFSAIPLSIANAVDPELDARGVLSGSARVSGNATSALVAFAIDGENLTTRQIADAGLAAVQISTQGEFSGNVVTLARADIRNANGLTLAGRGSIPLAGDGLNMRLQGNMPLSVLEPVLAQRGTTAQGVANLNVSILGSLDQPRTSGGIRVNNAILADPLSNLKVTGVDLALDLQDSLMADVKLTGQLASGGGVSLTGNLGLGDGFPADMALNLSSARYTDGETFSSVIDGRLKITGNLEGSPLLSGLLDLSDTEITVPDSFAADAELLAVDHVSPGQQVAETLARIASVNPQKNGEANSGSLVLNMQVNAPSRLFVRGRGLDAELGGSVQLSGPITNIQPSGEFTLRRGRLAILGQRLDLQEGSVTLAGDLDPLLDFLAVTSSGDVEAYIRLSGNVSDLKVTFSSNPELPEDEVLARIIFNRSITELSPAQVARLAGIAAELTGGNSPSFVDGIRKNAGLDDIDVVQDKQGNTAVKAGKYVSDDVYLGVQAGQETEATINLDITDSLTARGALDSDGNSSVGIFFEKDY